MFALFYNWKYNYKLFIFSLIWDTFFSLFLSWLIFFSKISTSNVCDKGTWMGTASIYIIYKKSKLIYIPVDKYDIKS